MCAVDSECTQNRQVRESVLIDLTIKSARHLVVDPSATVDLGLRSTAMLGNKALSKRGVLTSKCPTEHCCCYELGGRRENRAPHFPR